VIEGYGGGEEAAFMRKQKSRRRGVNRTREACLATNRRP